MGPDNNVIVFPKPARYEVLLMDPNDPDNPDGADLITWGRFNDPDKARELAVRLIACGLTALIFHFD